MIETCHNILSLGELRIDYFFAASEAREKVAFVFSPMMNRELDGNPFGGDLLFRNGFDVVSFKNARDDWFQSMPDDAFDQIEEALAPANYSRRVSYGSSMGGFAAVVFAKALKCDVVLAYSPQFSIREAFDRRWEAWANETQWRFEITEATISRDCAFYLVYDNRDADALHVERIKALAPPGNCIDILLPYVGHSSLWYLSEVGSLETFALAVLLDNRLPDGRLKARKESGSYLSNFAQALAIRGRFAQAFRLIDCSLELSNLNPTMVKRYRHTFFLASRTLNDLASERKRMVVERDKLVTDHRALHEERDILARRCDKLTRALTQPHPWVEWIIHRGFPVISGIFVALEAARLKRANFDEQFYLDCYPDVRKSMDDPVRHFTRWGGNEGRRVRFKD